MSIVEEDEYGQAEALDDSCELIENDGLVEDQQNLSPGRVQLLPQNSKPIQLAEVNEFVFKRLLNTKKKITPQMF